PPGVPVTRPAGRHAARPNRSQGGTRPANAPQPDRAASATGLSAADRAPPAPDPSVGATGPPPAALPPPRARNSEHRTTSPSLRQRYRAAAMTPPWSV